MSHARDDGVELRRVDGHARDAERGAHGHVEALVADGWTRATRDAHLAAHRRDDLGAVGVVLQAGERVPFELGVAEHLAVRGDERDAMADRGARAVRERARVGGRGPLRGDEARLARELIDLELFELIGEPPAADRGEECHEDRDDEDDAEQEPLDQPHAPRIR